MNISKIAIIGCGNLGLSIANGLIDNPTFDNSDLIATRRNLEAIQELKSHGVQITSDNNKAVQEANVIILSVKPYNVLNVCKEIKGSVQKGNIVVSTVTGISIDQIQEALGSDISVLRVMPNTAADVNESVTCIADKGASNEDYQAVADIFNAIGNTIRISEDLMEAATVLGACGIAYVLRFMRAMVQGGIQIGFDAKTATAIVNQTVKGASQLLIQNGMHPEYEIDKVTTPKGCTIVGINEMEHNGFSSSLIKGIVASYEAIEK
ncbi:MAG: pyrroline-5-carboxylate reductase [Crocinitomicaceae bacterium]